ncbi:DEAD/DEAH box helicase family protein [Candidatus Parcubacteria bacterium]|nr:DEAD/DEAH box helicase family protein [Candidatus Parcubacteria bacterium]
MPQEFLYEQLNSVSKMGLLPKEIPSFLSENLNPNFELREYQKEAFARFFHCYNRDFENKEYPLHFLFNMATGSGKTLIMAGLILYLYERGYRNFLFFVNSTNIIEKTKDNFLNNLSSKYLFNQKIFFENKQTQIKQVENFDGISDRDINICFTTIQKLHSDLHNEKENSLTLEDFKDKKIVLISDEAHHGQVQTKNTQKEMIEKPNWENTVEKIFKQDNENILLEFTATMDLTDINIVDKYRNKIIYKYELKEFRNDGYSKDVELLHTDTDRGERIIQAIILSQYRQEVAGKHGINLKPVILFKAQQTIAQSESNKKLFHKIIDNLSIKDIENIKKRTNIEILQKAFEFFKSNKITNAILVKKLKNSFAKSKTLSVNEEQEKEKHQLLLNSLEDKNNQIRAIFAVQKLNEGWDVLNLFDIVRLYETRDGRNNRPGKTTISEAQLIGRGARYFPFKLSEVDDKFKRKYDKNLDNELRVLEELHYHSHNESRYISEIKIALIEKGMIDENEVEVELKLKEEFKKTNFYKFGLVYANEKRPISFDKVKSIDDLGVRNKSIDFKVLSGEGKQTTVFKEDEDLIREGVKRTGKEISLKEIDYHIIRNALAKNDFFDFGSLKKYVPEIDSASEFVEKGKYLAGFKINFQVEKYTPTITNEDKFRAVLKLLGEIEKQIKENLTEYSGSQEFMPYLIKDKFNDKKIKVKMRSEREDGQIEFLEDKEWYVFNANYGTSEEKTFVKLIDRQINELRKNFKKIYLVRNERQLKIYNFSDGQAFEPDYLLFLVDKIGRSITYQLFLEPKGKYLAEGEKWKSKFLEEIKDKFKDRVLEFSKSQKYKIVGVPFYQSEDENKFEEKMFETLNIK